MDLLEQSSTKMHEIEQESLTREQGIRKQIVEIPEEHH